MHSFVRIVLSVALALAAISCGSESDDSADEGRRTGGTRQLVETLSLLSGDVLAEDAIASWVNRIDGGESTSDALIDELISSTRIGERVAPSLLFTTFLSAKNYYAVPSMYTLKIAAGSEDAPIYYLRNACTAAEAVKVNPWWDMAHTVRVCPDSYRPEKWTLGVEEHSYRSRMTLGCDGQVGSPEKEDQSLCGCGPNLIRCLKSEEQYLEMHESMAKELRDTTAYVVNHDMKLAKLFTSNQSVRDPNSEYLYQRRTLGALEGEGVTTRIRGLRNWPEDGIWAKREELVPGQHAGVLTSHQLLNWAPDRRQRQRAFFEILWCEGRDSFGATTEKIFEVSENPNLAFTHDSWERLAHTEVCTKCHARLDYGFQFFMGYPDGRATTHFMPELVREGSGPLYGRDIRDSRGEARLTPAGFARHATEQPEFERCMASQISNYVLGPEAPLDAHSEVLKSFEKSGEFRETMRTAFQLYAKLHAAKAGQPGRVSPDEIPLADDSAPTPPTSFHPGADFLGMLDEHCLGCHSDADIPFRDVARSYGQAVNLKQESFERPLAIRMLDQVAYGNMPRGTTFTQYDRERFVSMMIEGLWPASESRAQASDYYLGQMRALSGHQLGVALQATRDASGGSQTFGDAPIEWGALEGSLYSDQNTLAPGYLAIMALESAQDCRQVAGDDEKAFTACLARVLRLGKLAR